MSDRFPAWRFPAWRFPAWIHIGGPIKKSLRKGLIDAIREDGAGLEYGEPSTIEELEKEIDDGCPTCNGVLGVCDDQARYGCFETIEAFCETKRIHFDKHSDAYAESNGNNVYFRGETEATFYSSQEDNDLVDANELRKLVQPVMQNIDVFEKFPQQYQLPDLIPMLKEIWKNIHPPEPLSPLTWIDD